MDLYSGYINKLIDELSGLPGIGSKSAQRLAFHLIGLPEAKVNRIANAMIQARQNVRSVSYTHLTLPTICSV